LLFRLPDIVCRRTYILPVFLLLSSFFSPPNLRGVSFVVDIDSMLTVCLQQPLPQIFVFGMQVQLQNI